MKLWQKNNQKLHPLVEKYTVGNDPELDLILMPYDIRASTAHAKMLAKIGILSSEELEQLLAGLGQLQQLWEKGEVKITIADEDCHTVIENFLTEKCGPAGKKIHTGRSRNDQSLVALRLFMKEKLAEIKTLTQNLAQTFLYKAEKYLNIPLPGYSHNQQAMPYTLRNYLCAFFESLQDDVKLLTTVAAHIDQNPLGSAAGFGVNLPLDREFTTKELGFAKTQLNTLYCQNSRGKFESAVLEALVQIMLTLSKLAHDMIFFTSREVDFFEIPFCLTTGSSIMPQKKNLDLLEILRSQTSIIISHQHAIQNLSHKLLSGYNRDFQLIKKPLIESLQITKDSVEIAKLFVKNIIPKEQQIKSKICPDIYAAEIANELVQNKGIPFRDAYEQAMQKIT